MPLLSLWENYDGVHNFNQFSVDIYTAFYKQ